MTSRSDRFTPLQRVLHWLMAVCILAMLFIGVGMVSTVAPSYLGLMSIHRPLGIAILILAVVRVVVRLRSGAPSLPADMWEPLKLAGRLSHFALYTLMIVMPLIGWAMMSTADYPIMLAEGIRLPAILPPSARLHALLRDAHFYLAFAFFGLILMHIGAALFHALVRRDGVLRSMSLTPRDREQGRGGSHGKFPLCCVRKRTRRQTTLTGRSESYRRRRDRYRDPTLGQPDNPRGETPCRSSTSSWSMGCSLPRRSTRWRRPSPM